MRSCPKQNCLNKEMELMSPGGTEYSAAWTNSGSIMPAMKLAMRLDLKDSKWLLGARVCNSSKKCKNIPQLMWRGVASLAVKADLIFGLWASQSWQTRRRKSCTLNNIQNTPVSETMKLLLLRHAVFMTHNVHLKKMGQETNLESAPFVKGLAHASDPLLADVKAGLK